ncbi:protein MpBromo1 [Marchantia polymorpha subsp. ruderalis]|uniref:Bromo domain-containing protein n=2 Tax=Marchantia polymorpha TaxID=3197 RepID=A0AAF6ALI4_MARPO|nr:hypothetical protein MARPO_0005s0143 [Marchantia polymorpha]BBM97304.1 hypothetical protein Mp_1g04640 [Marchantia polymorpha subsp. ruderalis]|eukprot:PTQ48502.1 hypothetical protein MARPO_0005s0143 [Marchantia polymorpha]
MDNQRLTRLRSQASVTGVLASKPPRVQKVVEIVGDIRVDDRGLPVLRGENKRKRGLRGAGRRLKQSVELGKETADKLPEYDNGTETNREVKIGEKDGYSSAGEAFSSAASPLEKEFSTDISEEAKAMRQERRESSRLRVKPSKFRENLPTTILKPKEQKGSDDVSSSLEIILPMDVQNPSASQSLTHLDSEIDKPSQTGRRHIKTTQRPSRSSETLGSAHESSSSPRRGFEDSGLKASLAVVKRVMQIKSAEPFNEPVDPVALEIPDYLDVIKEPMDLGTIRELLESGTHYTTAQEVYEDVQLVWSNCRKYNQEGDPIMDIMKTAETVFNRHWNAAGLQDYMSSAVNPRKTNQEEFDDKVEYGEEDEVDDSEEDDDPKRRKSKESKAAAKLKAVKIVHFDTPPSRTKAKRSVSVEQVMAESKAREDKEEIDDVEMISQHLTHKCAQAAVGLLAAEAALLKTPDRKLQGSKNSKKKVVKETEQAECQQEQSEPEPKTPTTDKDTSSHGSPPPSSHKRRGSPPSSKRRTFGTAHHKPDCICVVCLGRRRKLAKLALEQGDKDGDDEQMVDETFTAAPVQEGSSKKHLKVRISDRSGKRSDISGMAVTASISQRDPHVAQPDVYMDEASDLEPITTTQTATPKGEAVQYYAANHELPLRKLSQSVLQMSHYLFGPTGITLLGTRNSMDYSRCSHSSTKGRLLEALSSLTWTEKKAGQV